MGVCKMISWVPRTHFLAQVYITLVLQSNGKIKHFRDNLRKNLHFYGGHVYIHKTFEFFLPSLPSQFLINVTLSSRFFMSYHCVMTVIILERPTVLRKTYGLWKKLEFFFEQWNSKLNFFAYFIKIWWLCVLIMS